MALILWLVGNYKIYHLVINLQDGTGPGWQDGIQAVMQPQNGVNSWKPKVLGYYYLMVGLSARLKPPQLQVCLKYNIVFEMVNGNVGVGY